MKQLGGGGGPFRETFVVYPPGHEVHTPSAYDSTSPEDPERVRLILDTIRKQGSTRGYDIRISEGAMATEEDVQRVHTSEYIERLKRLDLENVGFVGDSTYICTGSFQAALMAAGSAITASDMLLRREGSRAFVLTRPPGHHAKRDSFGGFCLLNNAAILAHHLMARKGMENIAILNIDAHASNGTQSIFYEDPRVLTMSVHQDPSHFYPFEGLAHQMGRKSGRGYTVNIPMPAGSGTKSYSHVYDNLVLPLLEEFSPGFIIVECGFDAHYSDHLTSLNLASSAYYRAFRSLSSRFKVPIVVLLEGGYGLRLGKLSLSVLAGLELADDPFGEEMSELSHLNLENLSVVKDIVEEQRTHLSEMWRTFQTPRQKIQIIRRLLERTIGHTMANQYLSLSDLEGIMVDRDVSMEDIVERMERQTKKLAVVLGESVSEDILRTLKRQLLEPAPEMGVVEKVKERLVEFIAWHMERSDAERMVADHFGPGCSTPPQAVQCLNTLEKDLVDSLGWERALQIVSKVRVQLLDEFRDDIQALRLPEPEHSSGGRRSRTDRTISDLEVLLAKRIGDMAGNMIMKRFERQRVRDKGASDRELLMIVIDDIVEGVLFYLGPKESDELRTELTSRLQRM